MGQVDNSNPSPGLLLFMVITIMLSGLLTGCGQMAKAGVSPRAEQTTPAAVHDDHGEVKLDKPAEHVVILEWTFGGPISSKVLIDQVVGVLTK